MSTEALNEQLVNQLECPVCFDTCIPPIYMCTNGHCVCSKCQPQMKSCGTCRLPGKPTLRCVQLEKIAELVKHPCVNQPRGCELTLKMDELAKHLPDCDHGFKCHLCTMFKGTIKDLKKHVKKKHSSRYFKCSADGFVIQKTDIITNEKRHDISHFSMYRFNKDIFWLEDIYCSTKCVFSRSLRVVSVDSGSSRYTYSVEFKSRASSSDHVICLNSDVQEEGSSSGDMDFVIPAGIIKSYKDGQIGYCLTIMLKK